MPHQTQAERCTCKEGSDTHDVFCPACTKKIHPHGEEGIDEMVRDFCSVVPKSKSEVRQRIKNLLSQQKSSLLREMREKVESLIGFDDGINPDTKMPHYLEFNKGTTTGWNECRQEALDAMKKMDDIADEVLNGEEEKKI